MKRRTRGAKPGAVTAHQPRNRSLKVDWQDWDRQIKNDAEAGKLHNMAQAAMREHAAGKTRPF